jgi:hypothetical protein
MRFDVTPTRLTRLIIDDQELELAELQNVMQRIQGAVGHVVPRSHQSYVGDALLNLAIEHKLHDKGMQHTTSFLIRVVDSVLENDSPRDARCEAEERANHR